MGLETGPIGHFAPVKINENTVLDFADINDVDLWSKENGHFARQHYAFKVSEQEFDEIFGRVQAEGLRYGSGPGPRLYDMQINHNRGGRGVYFDELNGHSIELLTAAPQT
jgi:catechol 2,3-dioxygenase-like lactoylglutathione lyase family enzyme